MYKTLNECYKNPSAAKQFIYEKLVQFAEDNGATRYGIRGHNAQLFTFVIETNPFVYTFTREWVRIYNDVNDTTTAHRWFIVEGTPCIQIV